MKRIMQMRSLLIFIYGYTFDRDLLDKGGQEVIQALVSRLEDSC